jgi:flavin-dependent dehydrogenase
MVEVYWGARCQIYVTPVGSDEVGIALLSRDPHLRLDAALSEFPDLHRRLRNARPASRERGAATVSRRLPRVFSGHVALVGDASGSVDAITGDGLTLSFLQACALSEALAESDLGIYQAEHRRLRRRASGTENLLLLLDRFPRLRGAIFRALAAESRIFPAIAAALLRQSGAGRPA